jgi:hypothetical protein
MLLKNLILILLFLHIKNLASDMLAKFAYGLQVRKFQGLIVTLLGT